MKPYEALRVVRAAMQTYKALELMEDALKVAEVAERDRRRLEKDISDLETRARDLAVQVANEERDLVQRRNAVEQETAELTQAVKEERDRLQRGRNQAQREHDARIKAMKDNEAKVAEEFDNAATERRETLASLTKKIGDAEATKAQLKADSG